MMSIMCCVQLSFDFTPFNRYPKISTCNVIGPISAPINLLEQTVHQDTEKSHRSDVCM